MPERRVIAVGTTATLAPSVPALYPQGVVRFTKDGVDPTSTSPILDQPITLHEKATLASAVFLPSGRRSDIIRTEIVPETLRPATRLEKAGPGALFAYAEGLFYLLPDFGTIPVKARGRAARISLDDVERALASGGTKLRAERFALRFDGFVRAPDDGVYRIVARSDDGVRVEIDGDKLLEDDGEHDARESSAEIALARGHHPIRITYFQGSEKKALAITMEGPGLPAGPIEVVTAP
jgi:hypothetical protein